MITDTTADHTAPLHLLIHRSQYAGEGSFYKLMYASYNEAETDARYEGHDHRDAYMACTSWLEDTDTVHPTPRISRSLAKGNTPALIHLGRSVTFALKGISTKSLTWEETKYLAAWIMANRDFRDESPIYL